MLVPLLAFSQPALADESTVIYTQMYEYNFGEASLDDCLSNAVDALNANNLGNGIDIDTFSDGDIREVTGYSDDSLHTASITCDKTLGMSYLGFAGYYNEGNGDSTFEWFKRLDEYGW